MLHRSEQVKKISQHKILQKYEEINHNQIQCMGAKVSESMHKCEERYNIIRTNEHLPINIFDFVLSSLVEGAGGGSA